MCPPPAWPSNNRREALLCVCHHHQRVHFLVQCGFKLSQNALLSYAPHQIRESITPAAQQTRSPKNPRRYTMKNRKRIHSPLDVGPSLTLKSISFAPDTPLKSHRKRVESRAKLPKAQCSNPFDRSSQFRRKREERSSRSRLTLPRRRSPNPRFRPRRVVTFERRASETSSGRRRKSRGRQSSQCLLFRKKRGGR